MRKLWLVVLLLSTCISQAQINLIIEDESQTGFKLVMDNYLQNSLSSKKLIVESAPTGPQQLVFLMANNSKTRVTKKIELTRPGNYRYVLMRNFEGKLQLRFRGRTEELPADHNHEKYSKLIAYREMAPAENTHSPQPAATPVKTPLPADTLKEKALASDTGQLAEEKTASAKAPALPAKGEGENQYGAVLDSLKAREFEFEKLKLAREKILPLPPTEQQVIEVLRVFKYDQTRMQFLEKALEIRPGLKFSADLLKAEFEYEISRQKVSELMQ